MSSFGGDEDMHGRRYGKIRTVFRDEVIFDSDFDSGNLDNVVEIPKSEFDYEFNLWTAPDCATTEFENSNRSWFYFSVRGGCAGGKMLLSIVNLNVQMKLYQQGMTVVFKQRGGWERMRERPTYEMGNWGMKLSFTHSVPSITRLATYYAFCYPHSYTECQRKLLRIENNISSYQDQNIYYHRELLTTSLDGRRVDLLTISSTSGMSQEAEPRIEGLFPSEEPRARIFRGKKVYVLSARVHPGEVPGSHIFNGFLDFILNREDLRAQKLRDKFVFKLVPMLNPDGVARGETLFKPEDLPEVLTMQPPDISFFSRLGHYRTDSRGANLNRYYLDPDPALHPSIFALRGVILHHHRRGVLADGATPPPDKGTRRARPVVRFLLEPDETPEQSPLSAQESSGVAAFVDLHAHAAKRGCFIYGNHFEDVTVQTENMLYPKLVSLNSPHFDFGYCLFSEKNMYWKDKRDGLSKEGSGRVGIYKATGIIRSYTLECNYNTGRLCNSIAPADPPGRATPPSSHQHNYPPKFTVPLFEELGKSLAISALDLCECNPWSRVRKSQYGSLHGVRLALSEQIVNSRACREASSSSLSSGRQKSGEARNRPAARPGSGVLMTSDPDESERPTAKTNSLTLPARSKVNGLFSARQSCIPTPSYVARQTQSVGETRRFLVGDISKSSLLIAKSTLSSLSVPDHAAPSPSPHRSNPSTYQQFTIRTVKRELENDPLIPEVARVPSKGLVGRKERSPQTRGTPANSANLQTLQNKLPDMTLSPPKTTSLVMGLDLATLFPSSQCPPATPPGYLSVSPAKSRTPSTYRMRRGEILRERRKYEDSKTCLKGIEGKEFMDKDFNSEEIRLVKRLPKSLQDKAMKCLREQKLSDAKSEIMQTVDQKSTNGKIENKNSVLYSAWTVAIDKKKGSKIKSKPRKNSFTNFSCAQPATTRAPRSSKAPSMQRTKKKSSSSKCLPQL